MKKIYSFIVFCLVFGCSSNNFKLEDKSLVDFKEAYFQNWTAGIKGGGSGYNITILTKESSLVNIKIEGIYFKNDYSKLNFVKPNKYQGFVKSDKNSDVINPTLNGDKVKTIKEEKEIIPFQLKDNEAVIMCIKDSKKKYFKLILKEKQLEEENIPR